MPDRYCIYFLACGVPLGIGKLCDRAFSGCVDGVRSPTPRSTLVKLVKLLLSEREPDTTGQVLSGAAAGRSD